MYIKVDLSVIVHTSRHKFLAESQNAGFISSLGLIDWDSYFEGVYYTQNFNQIDNISITYILVLNYITVMCDFET